MDLQPYPFSGPLPTLAFSDEISTNHIILKAREGKYLSVNETVLLKLSGRRLRRAVTYLSADLSLQRMHLEWAHSVSNLKEEKHTSLESQIGLL